MENKLKKRTFSVICNCCGTVIPKLKIGLNSYVEAECPTCNIKFYVKTDGNGRTTQCQIDQVDENKRLKLSN